MKKRISILVLVAIAITTFSATAQWRYGVRLGGEFTKPTYDRKSVGGPSATGGCGFAGGLTFEWQLPNTGFAIAASPMYERRTMVMHPAPFIGNDGATWKLGGDYVAIPLDFKYEFGLNKGGLTKPLSIVCPFVLTGPDFAYNVGKTSDISNRFNFGWNVGAGIDIANFIQLYGGYRFGITDVTNKDCDIYGSGGFVSVAILFDF